METVLENQSASVEVPRHVKENSSTRFVNLMLEFILLVNAMALPVTYPKL